MIPEAGGVFTQEVRREDRPSQDGPSGQHEQQDEHHPRRFMRGRGAISQCMVIAVRVIVGPWP
ncbi:MAG: hypothetical protein R3C16_00135 [Hyphomonadaceae bacterium]